MQGLPGLAETLKRNRKRARKRLPGLPTLGRKQRRRDLPDLDAGPQWQVSTVSDELARLANRLDDVQLAKKILKLKEKYPHATVPELVAIEWLERHNKRWAFQVWAMGGRLRKGGQVLDLIVDVGIGIVVIEVQGNYFHNRPGARQRDAAQRLAVRGLKIWGKPVRALVEVWESRLLDKRKRNAVMEAAMTGQELGP